MADKWPLANGNWSDAANWNGGTKPQTGDDVYSDNKTVTIDENVNIGTGTLRNSQRTGGTAGGGFVLNSGLTLVANIVATNATCVTVSYTNGTASIVGNVSCPGPTQFISGVLFSGTGTLTITGNVVGGSSNEQVGVRSTNIHTLNIIGNVSTAGTQAGAEGLRITSTGTINITGDVSCTSSANAILGNTAYFLNITGTVNSSGGVVIRSLASTPRVTVNGTISGSGATGTISLEGAGATIVHNGNLVSPPNGRVIIGTTTYLISSSATMEHQYRVNNAGSPGVARSLYTGGQNLGQPTSNHVRSGQTYGVSNEFTGTLAVPSPSYVALGVATDNTTGTLAYLSSTDLQAALSPNAPVAVQRTVDDTKAITFSWPVSGATITGQKSVDNGAYSAVSGAIAFLRTESNRHYYTLAYNAADRLDVEGTIRYKLTDGTYTKYVNLHVYDVTSDVTVYPLSGNAPDTIEGTTIKTFLESKATIGPISVFDTNNDPVNLSGVLEIIISKKWRGDILVIPNASITRSGVDNNQFSFSVNGATSIPGEHTWAIKRVSDNDPLMFGDFIVQQVANKD
jgi:hypothetical protein